MPPNIKGLVDQLTDPHYTVPVPSANQLTGALNSGRLIASPAHLGLTAYKYGRLVQPSADWDELTLTTRGLIIDRDGTVVARGWNKFFSPSQWATLGVLIDPDQPVTAMEKVDGSLGICFHHGGQWQVWTQASGQSEQAIHATKVFREKYNDTPVPANNVTLLVEIVYPENRIVTDYHGLDDLILLGGADSNGRWISPDTIEWDGPRVTTRRTTLHKALNDVEHLPSTDDEGFVVVLDNGLMTKVKSESYLRLHAIATQTSPRKVIEMLENGEYDDYVTLIPDEFLEKVNSWATQLKNLHRNMVDRVEATRANLEPGMTNKERALTVIDEYKDNPLLGSILLSALNRDNMDIESAIWTMMRRHNYHQKVEN